MPVLLAICRVPLKLNAYPLSMALNSILATSESLQAGRLASLCCCNVSRLQAQCANPTPPSTAPQPCPNPATLGLPACHILYMLESVQVTAWAKPSCQGVGHESSLGV